jgi:hypothetical protein
MYFGNTLVRITNHAMCEIHNITMEIVIRKQAVNKNILPLLLILYHKHVDIYRPLPWNLYLKCAFDLHRKEIKNIFIELLIRLQIYQNTTRTKRYPQIT